MFVKLIKLVKQITGLDDPLIKTLNKKALRIDAILVSLHNGMIDGVPVLFINHFMQDILLKFKSN